MADFGVQATSLSAPQGAGSSPIAGVVTQASTYQFPGAALKIGLEGMEGLLKDEAASKKQRMLAPYVQEMDSLAAAREQGRDASEISGREKAINRKYLSQYAGNPELLKSFMDIRGAYKGTTAIGEAIDSEAIEQDVVKQKRTLAMNKGFDIPAGATGAQVDSIFQAAQARQRAEDEWKANVAIDAEARARRGEQRAMTSEERAKYDHDEKVRVQERKRQSTSLITTLASKEIDATMAMGQAIAADVASGKLDRQSAELQLTRQSQGLNAAFQSIAAENPELAGPWKILFDDITKSSVKLLDPSSQKEDLQNQFQTTMLKAKILATADPDILAVAVMNELMPHTPVATFNAAPAAVKIMAMFGANAPGETKLPQVVAGYDKPAEQAVYATLKSAMNNLKTGVTPRTPTAMKQYSNTLNNVLTQAGGLLNSGTVKDSDLKELAGLLASDEFSIAVKENLLSPDARKSAESTFQAVYQQSVVRGIQTKLMADVPQVSVGNSLMMGDTSQVDNSKPPKMADLVNVEFNGSGIRFVSSGRSSSNTALFDMAANAKEIQQMTTATNQLIKIGAHLDGTTDYAKYWEANKYKILPDYFADPVKLKPGDVKDGWKFKGGNTRDRNSWERVTNGTQ